MSRDLQVTPQFKSWKQQTNKLPTSEADFEKWLFVHVSSVLFANKAGELLTLPIEQFGLSLVERLQRIQVLTEQWGYAYQLLCQNNCSAKVIIYQPQLVQAVLTEITPCVLHKSLNYPCCVGPQEFLTELGRRWQQSGEIPHEVGLALGYPIKDVLGFMGLSSLEFTGCCGWQVYGDPQPSHRKSQQFMQAKQQASIFVAL